MNKYLTTTNKTRVESFFLTKNKLVCTYPELINCRPNRNQQDVTERDLCINEKVGHIFCFSTDPQD